VAFLSLLFLTVAAGHWLFRVAYYAPALSCGSLVDGFPRRSCWHSSMAEVPLRQPVSSDAQEAALAQYRPYSAWAVCGLVLGIVSVLAFWHPFLWCLPVVAALVNVYALRRIAHYGSELAGRGLALVGLCLSLTFGIVAPTRVEMAAEAQRAEAREVALQWFAYLRDGQPEMAAQLQVEPQRRRMAEDDVWAYYRDDPTGPDFMRKFVEDRAVANLLALGKQAQVRYCETEVNEQLQSRATVVQLYAVTFERDGQPATFLVRLVLQKPLRGNPANSGWWIAKTSLVTEKPELWPETAGR